MGRFILAVIVLAVVVVTGLWFASGPTYLKIDPPGEPDLANGERVFWAGGCTSCHAAPGAKDKEKLVLSGGLALSSWESRKKASE